MSDQAGGIGSVIVGLTERGAALEAAYGAADGVLCFNRLYLRMTVAIAAAVAEPGYFADPATVAGLDPIFAQLYFDAVDAEAAGRTASASWQALIAARAQPGTASLQFALAGMNAHINHDLVAALLSLWSQGGGRPGRESPAYADFSKVNDLVAIQVEAEKAELATGVIKELDTLAGPIDSAVAVWSITAAREQAWTTAEDLWDVRESAAAWTVALAALDRIVAVVSAGLLRPIGEAGASGLV